MQTSTTRNSISLADAISIGIGGMIGAGIFSILGVVAEAAGSAMWVSFLLGGFIVSFSAYSYAKLGAAYPTAGGAVEFLVQGLGEGRLSGSINIFMWIGYIISIALYAQGFAGYFLAFIGVTATPMLIKISAITIVLLFTFINALGAGSVGRAELFIVIVKMTILLLFASVGLFYIHADQLSVATWPPYSSILFGTGILFIGYEGFGLVTNAAGNMVNPKKTLPQALYASVMIVIAVYLAVSVTVIGNLSASEIKSAGDFALAQAAKPFLGMFGFKLIAIAALFSTASAINATLFGAANICYMIARDGELPASFTRGSWHGATEGLFISAGLVAIFILFFNLASVTMMGSGAFLFIYAMVNVSHLRILQQTQASKLLVCIAAILCLLMFVVLEVYTYQQAPAAVYTTLGLLLGSYVLEVILFKHRGAILK